MQVEDRDVDSITPYEQNPRINDEAVDAVAASIREFGFRQPIVIDDDGVIIVGHTRWKAAKKLGMTTVPTHVAAGLSEQQKRAYRIADNQTADLADWDYELLSAELRGLEDDGFELDIMGFGAARLAEIMQVVNEGLTDPDAVPRPPGKATTRPGDLWILGDHRLLCGDSGAADDVDRLLEGAAIDLVNMDPPYNVCVEPRSSTAIAAGNSSYPDLSKKMHHQAFDVARGAGNPKKARGQMRPKDRPLVNDFLSDEAFGELLLAWFGNASRVLKPGGSFFIWGGYANLGNYPAPLKTAGLYFSQAIVWDKQHPVLTRKDFMGAFELCFYGWKEGAGHGFYGLPNVRDVWRLSRAEDGTVAMGRGINLVATDGSRVGICPPHDGWREVRIEEDVQCYGRTECTDVWSVKKVSPQKMIHLTEKPVELAVRAIQYGSLPGENVLDLFGGSGSTLIGCEQTGRRGYLMELDALYCDVMVNRWEEFTGRKAELAATRHQSSTPKTAATKSPKRARKKSPKDTGT